MGLSFWLSPLLFGKNLLRALLGEQMQLPDRVWHRLNFAWVAFFALMGLLNLWVAYSFSTDTWVNFKLFGGIGLMLLFTLAQGLYLSRYLTDEPTTAPSRRRPIPHEHGPRCQPRSRSKPRCARHCSPAALEVQDDSHLHAGHAGAREGRHFSVRITSARFSGLQPRGAASPRV